MSTSTPADNPALHKFLEVDIHMTKLTKGGKSNGILGYSDRLNIVVENFRNILLIYFPPNPKLSIMLNAKRIASEKPLLVRGNSRSPFLDDTSSNNAYNIFPRTDSYNSTISNTTEKTKSRSNTVSSKVKSIDEHSLVSGSVTNTSTMPTLTNNINNSNPIPTTASGRRDSISVFNYSLGGMSNANMDHATIASELIKRQQFIAYMNKNYLNMESHCLLVLEGFNKPTYVMNQLSAIPGTGPNPGNTQSHKPLLNNTVNTHVIHVLKEELNIDNCLDEIADMVLEASMQHYTLTLSTNNIKNNTDQALVVKEFKEYNSKRDGEMLGGHYSRSSSGSKYSYFNKELKRLNSKDKKGSHMSNSKPPTPRPGLTIGGPGGLTATSTVTSISTSGDVSLSGSLVNDVNGLGISYQSYGSKIPKPGSSSAGSSYVQPSSVPNRTSALMK